MKNGCFYYCDGGWRQSLNVAFNKDVAAAGDGQSCDYMDRCEFDGIKLRPGDKVEAYPKIRSDKCDTEKVVLTCTGADFNGYHSYCMPHDGTDVPTIVNVFCPGSTCPIT